VKPYTVHTQSFGFDDLRRSRRQRLPAAASATLVLVLPQVLTEKGEDLVNTVGPCLGVPSGCRTGPSGLNSAAGICSETPFGAIVVMERAVVPRQPPTNKKERASRLRFTRIVPPVDEPTLRVEL
jgi:hypothetical protein